MTTFSFNSRDDKEHDTVCPRCGLVLSHMSVKDGTLTISFPPKPEPCDEPSAVADAMSLSEQDPKID
jgi:hypothetical protein